MFGNRATLLTIAVSYAFGRILSRRAIGGSGERCSRCRVVPPTSCSDLIGASIPQTGFCRNTGEALRSSRRATIIHYANQRGRCVGGSHRRGGSGKRRRRLERRGDFPFLPRPHPQRATTVKAVSPFSNASHVYLRWNVATVSLRTASCGALLIPRSVLPRLKPCRLFPVLRTFTYAGTPHRFPCPPLHAVRCWFPRPQRAAPAKAVSPSSPRP